MDLNQQISIFLVHKETDCLNLETCKISKLTEWIHNKMNVDIK